MSLSFSEIQRDWVAAGGSPADAPLMAGIAEAESTGNPTAINNTAFPNLPNYHPVQPGNSPEYSVGLWQMNLASGLNSWDTGRLARYGQPGQLEDPAVNARAAVSLLGSGRSGLSNWQGDNAYKIYEGAGGGAAGVQAVLTSQYGSGNSGSTGVGSSTGSSLAPGNSGSTSTGGGGDLLSTIGNDLLGSAKELLLRLFELAAGGFLLYLGLKGLASALGARDVRQPDVNVNLPQEGRFTQPAPVQVEEQREETIVIADREQQPAMSRRLLDRFDAEAA